MNAQQLFLSMNGIEDEILEASEKKKTITWKKVLSAAACLFLVLGALWFVFDGTVFIYNTPDQPIMSAMTVLPEGYFSEKMSSEQIESIAPKPTRRWMKFSGTAGFIEDGPLHRINLYITTSTPKETVYVSIGRMADSCVLYSKTSNIPTKCGRVTYLIYEHITPSSIRLSAETTINGVEAEFVYDLYGDTKEKLWRAKRDFEIILRAFARDPFTKEAVEQIQPRLLQVQPDQEMIHEQALQDETFGSFFLRKHRKALKMSSFAAIKLMKLISLPVSGRPMTAH